MDTLIIWKSLILFLFTMYFFWIIFYTFQPTFLNSSDKIDPTTGFRVVPVLIVCYPIEEEPQYSFIV